MTYSDESAGVDHGLLLLDLLQEGSLDVLVGLGRAGAQERHGGWEIGDVWRWIIIDGVEVSREVTEI